MHLTIDALNRQRTNGQKPAHMETTVKCVHCDCYSPVLKWELARFAPLTEPNEFVKKGIYRCPSCMNENNFKKEKRITWT